MLEERMTFECEVGVSFESVGASSMPERVSHREIDRNLRRLAQADRELAIEMGKWFLIARRTDAHRELGYASFFEYVQRLFGMGVRAAEERLRVAEALESLPEIAAALGAGVINYSVARDVTRVAEPDNEQKWIAAVMHKTAKEVREMVRGHALGDLPTDRPDPALEPRELSLKLTPSAYASFFEAKRALEERLGHRLTDAEIIEAMCADVLAGGEAGSRKAPYQVALSICPQCDRTYRDSAGEVIEVPPTVAEMARCDGDWLGRVDGDATEDVAASIPAAVRRQVVARDHHRCTVPGCRAYRVLAIHHIEFRCHGGGHEPGNLTTLCLAHHTALHDDQLRIRGTAPHALRFTHADGRAYGTPSAHAYAELPPPAPPSDTTAGALSALTNLGFRATEAKAALARASAHVCADASLEALVRACLIELRPCTNGQTS
jgi:hypothetical protein